MVSLAIVVLLRANVFEIWDTGTASSVLKGWAFSRTGLAIRLKHIRRSTLLRCSEQGDDRLRLSPQGENQNKEDNEEICNCDVCFDCVRGLRVWWNRNVLVGQGNETNGGDRANALP